MIVVILVMVERRVRIAKVEIRKEETDRVSTISADVALNFFLLVKYLMCLRSELKSEIKARSQNGLFIDDIRYNVGDKGVYKVFVLVRIVDIQSNFRCYIYTFLIVDHS